MPIPVREQIPTLDPLYCIEVTDDGSRTLLCDGNRFHSGCGAVAECDWVYLRGSGMTVGNHGNWPRSILEVGFGSAMAMLLTIDRALSSAQPIEYIALENSPISARVLRELQLDQHLRNPLIATQFLDQWDRCLRSTAPASDFRIVWDAKTRATVLFVDAVKWITGHDPKFDQQFDAVYFDPFDPLINRELWQQAVFEGLWRRINPGGRLVTYCVQGEVRRTLQRVGFETQRVPGPPSGKREVMIATKPASN